VWYHILIHNLYCLGEAFTMFQALRAALAAEISGEAAKNLVARISQWHRIQASPMYREAATWLHQTLCSWGLPTELEAFPTREGLSAWGELLFQEWACDEATLDLLDAHGAPTKRLADYRAVPLSLLPRSSSADGDYEVVVLDGGDREEHYAGRDLRGKLVLTRSMPMSIHRLAVERYGAAGVIFDGMRSIPDICPPGDLPDAIQYASWWWFGGETRCFGFALSPREGNLLRQQLAAGHGLRVRARVRSQFSDGAIECVSATIPGQSAEEVLVTAHLCHPAPCANDNASGAAAIMEIARALHTLIEAGQLPRPRRTIRFLWMPEMTGSYLYLAHHEERLPRTVAGINLDMVGADQAQTGSVSLIVRTSEAMPSFVNDLLEAICAEPYGPEHTFAGRNQHPLHRHATTPASNGSDHYILSDPSVGIPSPSMVEWPDRFYHTTADTLEKVSPVTLARNATNAAIYAYFVANATSGETQWLAREMNARFVARIASELQAASTAALSGQRPGGPPFDRRIAFRIERQGAALASLHRLDPGFDAVPFQRYAQASAELLWQQQRDLLANWHHPEPRQLPPAEDKRIPRRRQPGPLSIGPHLNRLPPAERDAARESLRNHHGYPGLIADLALYWVDGQRTLASILDLVELECDTRDPEGLLAYMHLLERLELIDFE
jgi:aminopeptidase YwaD